MALRAPPPIPGVPEVRGLPVLGSLPAFGRDPVGFLRRIARDHGDLVQLTLGTHRLLLVNEPALIEEALVQRHRSLHKDALYELLRPLLGNGLVTAEGDAWKQDRRLCAPSFTPRHVATWRDAMDQEVQRWVDGLPATAELDLFHEMMRMTARIVLRTLFGDVEVDVRAAASALDTVMAEFVHDAQGRRAFLPPWVPTRGRLRARRAIRVLDDLLVDILAARRGRGPGDDLLSALLAARDEEGRGMDDVQLRDEAITLFAAGHETTATALTYTLLLLATHRDEERALLEDPSRVEAVLQESMRLLPPVWAIGRETQEPIALGSITVPAGIQVLLAQCVTHIDPRYWDAPTAFRPGRWLDGSERPRFAYFPFGGGPRVCIGNHFAMLEGTLALNRIVPTVSFEPLGPVPPAAIASITWRPSEPVPVRVTRRQ
ncbi:MAG: cytochrome P450 [Alphaproteobacteria bacterium]|nr:cytochrome P450 [Alphaproteobacteria bacterium]